MKVIGRDNFGRDYNGGQDERVAAEGLELDVAKMMAERLNAMQGEHGLIYWCVQPDDYIPYKFEGY